MARTATTMMTRAAATDSTNSPRDCVVMSATRTAAATKKRSPKTGGIGSIRISQSSSPIRRRRSSRPSARRVTPARSPCNRSRTAESARAHDGSRGGQWDEVSEHIPGARRHDDDRVGRGFVLGGQLRQAFQGEIEPDGAQPRADRRRDGDPGRAGDGKGIGLGHDGTACGERLAIPGTLTWIEFAGAALLRDLCSAAGHERPGLGARPGPAGQDPGEQRRVRRRVHVAPKRVGQERDLPDIVETAVRVSRVGGGNCRAAAENIGKLPADFGPIRRPVTPGEGRCRRQGLLNEHRRSKVSGQPVRDRLRRVRPFADRWSLLRGCSSCASPGPAERPTRHRRRRASASRG